jgi:hypothetical protein
MASVIVTDEDRSRARDKLRAAGLDGWFKVEPGFRFLDCDGDECVVIGWGGFRKAEPLGSLTLYPNKDEGIIDRLGCALYSLKFHPATLVGAYLYKGEHHLLSIPDMERLNECRPLS